MSREPGCSTSPPQWVLWPPRLPDWALISKVALEPNGGKTHAGLCPFCLSGSLHSPDCVGQWYQWPVDQVPWACLPAGARPFMVRIRKHLQFLAMIMHSGSTAWRRHIGARGLLALKPREMGWRLRALPSGESRRKGRVSPVFVGEHPLTVLALMCLPIAAPAEALRLQFLS